MVATSKGGHKEGGGAGGEVNPTLVNLGRYNPPAHPLFAANQTKILYPKPLKNWNKKSQDLMRVRHFLSLQYKLLVEQIIY